MLPFIVSLLATVFLPTGCSLPGWSFCVRMPADARMEVAQDQTDPVIYQFAMADGSRAFVAVGESTEAVHGGQWSERRQGLETVRWQADGDGRIDYYIERVWAESAGIPRFLHAWIEASETGEISDAEALIQTLRSCDPRMCPALGPVASPALTVTAPETEREDANRGAVQFEPIAEAGPVETEVNATAEAEASIENEAAIPLEPAAPTEAVVDVSEAEIRRSGMETIVEVVRVPLPADAEAPLPGVEAEIGDAEAETAPEQGTEPDSRPNPIEAETPPRRRSGPIMLTDDN
jgi:hypothetical protein